MMISVVSIHIITLKGVTGDTRGLRRDIEVILIHIVKVGR